MCCKLWWNWKMFDLRSMHISCYWCMVAFSLFILISAWPELKPYVHLCFFNHPSGPTGCISAAGYHVHQVCTDIPQVGTVLWSNSPSSEETRFEACFGWSDGPSAGIKEWNGAAGILRVSLLWWCLVWLETHSCKFHCHSFSTSSFTSHLDASNGKCIIWFILSEWYWNAYPKIFHPWKSKSFEGARETSRTNLG